MFLEETLAREYFGAFILSGMHPATPLPKALRETLQQAKDLQRVPFDDRNITDIILTLCSHHKPFQVLRSIFLLSATLSTISNKHTRKLKNKTTN